MTSWQDICENMSTAVLLADHENRVVNINTAMEDLFLIGRRSLIGKPIEYIFLDQEKVFDTIDRVKKNQSSYILREVKFEKPSPFEADITISSIDSDQGHLQVMLEIVRIDRISRLARETQNIEQQQTNRLIMRSLSHEIKNPLSGIRGAAQLLSSELEDPELREFTDVVIKESDRLTSLVNRVMGSHKQYAAEPVNIHYVIEHVVRLMSASTAGKLELFRDYDPGLPELVGDDGQLIQAVMNIIKNAVEAQNGMKVPFIGLRTCLERNYTIGKTLHRNLIKLQIWDHGEGVPDEIRTQIFNPLITGRAEGTGLGLAITQEIIQRHQGLVVLEEWGENTCFSVYLPIIPVNKVTIKNV